MVATHIPVLVKVVNGEPWLVLNSLSNRGLLRAVSVEKRKNPVPDWDGHHCDEAAVEGSVRYYPKKWQMQ